jgi:hypothetical protein
LLSSEANKRIKNDHEHFGSFKITTAKVDDTKINLKEENANTTKADGS